MTVLRNFLQETLNIHRASRGGGGPTLSKEEPRAIGVAVFVRVLVEGLGDCRWAAEELRRMISKSSLLQRGKLGVPLRHPTRGASARWRNRSYPSSDARSVSGRGER
jgi:hypothetical protein